MCRALLVLALAAAAAAGVVYEQREVQRPAAALLDVWLPSPLLCAISCRRERRCRYWTFGEPSAGHCLLYPLPVTAQETSVTALVRLSSADRAPPGFVRYQGTSKAFRKLLEPQIYGNQIVEWCGRQGPGVTPAVPQSEAEFQVIQSLVPQSQSPEQNAWTGLFVTATPAVYGDMNGVPVDLPQAWLSGSNVVTLSLPCVRLFKGGLDLNVCDDALHSYICQYEGSSGP